MRVSELAALSCKQPFLVLHPDKLVLWPQPKLVSLFYVNQDIVLPSFYPKPQTQEGKILCTLDVVHMIRCYRRSTAAIHQPDSLFALPLKVQLSVTQLPSLPFFDGFVG